MSTLKDNLHRHMNRLCLEIGSKHCGSPELEKAGIYIEEQLKSFGLDTRREKMEVIGWNYQGFRLWNVTDNRAVPDATTCYFSNNVEIYDHPLWIREEDLNRLEDMNVAGRLCMVAAWYDMGNVFGYNSLAEKLDRLGAAAAIFLNRLHCQHAPSTKVERSPFLENLGVAAVAQEGAVYIGNHPDDLYFMKVEANKFPSSSFNVIGRLGHGERMGVIGAHFDTAPLIQGAGDNASGTAAILELARIWAQKYPEGIEGWTLEFAAFTGEEYIPYTLPVGSGDYVKRHKDENIRFYLNLDDVSSFFAHWDLELGDGRRLPRLDTTYKTVPADFSGDDRSFHSIGVPTLWLTGRKLYNELHTAMDDMTHSDLALIEKAVLVNADLLSQLTDLKRWEKKTEETLTISQATPADYEAMAELGVRAWAPIYEGYREQLGEELFRSFFRDHAERKHRSLLTEVESNPSFVGKAGGRIVAFGSCRISGAVGEILGNAVDPACGGRGWGSKMQEYLLNYLISMGCTHAFVETGLDEAHGPARHSYEKNGFEKNLKSVKYFKKL